MTKEAVLKAREIFGNERIRVVCDNMIIAYDNMPGGVPVVWDDDNEQLLWFKADTGNDMGDTCPLEVTFTEYEHIQYMEGHLTKQAAMEIAAKYKDKLGDEYYDRLIKLIAQASGAIRYKVEK